MTILGTWVTDARRNSSTKSRARGSGMFYNTCMSIVGRLSLNIESNTLPSSYQSAHFIPGKKTEGQKNTIRGELRRCLVDKFGKEVGSADHLRTVVHDGVHNSVSGVWVAVESV